MTRLRALGIRLLALLMLLQGGAVAAHGLHVLVPAGGWLMEICALDGPRTVLVDENGQPIEPAGHSGFCPVCHGLPHIALPPPGVSPASPRPAAIARLPVAGAGQLPATARAPPYAPRAPPAPV